MSRSAFILAAVLALGAGGSAAPAASAPPPKGPPINHIVVIYEENHSFDNLFGGWERVNGLDARVRPTSGDAGRHACCRACRRTT